MIEDVGNLWTYPADAVVITTNGTINNNGKAVMGRGCAREARDKFSGLDYYLALKLYEEGNHVHILLHDPQINWSLISFPVKHNYFEKANYKLIKRSAEELKKIVDEKQWKQIVMPRPGCGNGKRDWNKVKLILDEILDDRFVAITYGN